jgi:hypothetical protein
VLFILEVNRELIMADTLTSARPTQYYSQGLRKRFQLDSLKFAPSNTSSGSTEDYADIRYELNERKYLERSKKRLASGGLPNDVPPGFPANLQGALVWSTADLPNEEQYIIRIGPTDKEEIRYALAFFKGMLSSPIKFSDRS